MVTVRTLRRGGAALALWILLVAAGTPSPAVGVPTSVSVTNGQPAIQVWTLASAEPAGAFAYQVRAHDANGIEDLSHIVLHIVDANGRLTTHRDAQPLHEGRQAAIFHGLAIGNDPLASPYQAELHLYDRTGAETRDEQPVLIQPIPAPPVPVPSAPKLRLGPLALDIDPLTTGPHALVLAVALSVLALVGSTLWLERRLR